eukprot:CAMPEP_0114398116 /NCGR_PEP_ID=MMETSP0102-20121206/14697_1 /TAXON_ID=38822 ORGANISM="Pteridomonas danica, Strain PT" /NCGR_SAMPLE_ID=MMETSP0102 /ASSEMBLY_ACC=CAM_ASM_000212 /LENGTH=316 /DNA_ID=CAMNT_0001559415 /DNA_START=6697 /DNA_END=7647 /DNA_ORIENTATION=+
MTSHTNNLSSLKKNRQIIPNHHGFSDDSDGNNSSSSGGVGGSFDSQIPSPSTLRRSTSARWPRSNSSALGVFRESFNDLLSMALDGGDDMGDKDISSNVYRTNSGLGSFSGPTDRPSPKNSDVLSSYRPLGLQSNGPSLSPRGSKQPPSSHDFDFDYHHALQPSSSHTIRKQSDEFYGPEDEMGSGNLSDEERGRNHHIHFNQQALPLSSMNNYRMFNNNYEDECPDQDDVLMFGNNSFHQKDHNTPRGSNTNKKRVPNPIEYSSSSSNLSHHGRSMGTLSSIDTKPSSISCNSNGNTPRGDGGTLQFRRNVNETV